MGFKAEIAMAAAAERNYSPFKPDRTISQWPAETCNICTQPLGNSLWVPKTCFTSCFENGRRECNFKGDCRGYKPPSSRNSRSKGVPASGSHKCLQQQIFSFKNAHSFLHLVCGHILTNPLGHVLATKQAFPSFHFDKLHKAQRFTLFSQRIETKKRHSTH